MKKLVSILILTFIILSFFVVPVFAKTIKWTANSVWPPKNHQSQGLIEFAEKVKERTNGKLIISVQVGGALGYKGPELLKVVRDGLVPLSDFFAGSVAGDEPLFGINTLPFIVKDFKDAKLLMDVARPYFDKVIEKKWKQKILYTSPWPGAGLWTKKPIKSVADMKGLKTRTYDKNGAEVVRITGGTPYALPYSEVYSSLATGLIDSVITSTPTAVDAKFWEVLKYFQRLNITQAIDFVTVNLRVFNKLPPEIQKVLIETGKEMEDIMWARLEEVDNKSEKICNEHGIISVPVSEEFRKELLEITAPLREEWFKKAPADAKSIYEEYMKKREK